MMPILEQKTVIFIKEPINSINRTATLMKLEEDLYRVSNTPNGTVHMLWTGAMLAWFRSNNEIVLL
jgi:hypothetical protein